MGGDAEGQIGAEQFLRTVVAPSFAREIGALRAEIAALEHELQEREGAEASIGLEVEGREGGRWFLNVRGGRMDVALTPALPVLFLMRHGEDDWRALSARGATLGGQPGGSARPRSFLTRSRIARLRGIAGTVRVVLVEDESGAERAVTLHFGPGEPREPPQATVSLRASDARRLREGALDPQAAFLRGLVTISGDMGLAVRLGTALFG